MDFGSQDQWLAGEAPIPQPKKLNTDAPVRQNRFGFTNTRADVVFAFYGYNESFAGPAGLEKFKHDLARFIKHTLAQRYNGKTPPRLVLFSPIAHENLGDPNLPDGAAGQRPPELYTRRWPTWPRPTGVLFVDLFTPSLANFLRQAAHEADDQRHPSQRRGGPLRRRHRVPGTVRRSRRRSTRCGSTTSAAGDQSRRTGIGSIRYRTTDGYSTYGDRAFLRFVGGQTNYEVVQRELEMIDLMTSNRDKVVWAAAQGRDRQSRRLEPARLHPRDHQQARPAAGGKAHLSQRRGRNQKDDRAQRNEGQPVRLRGAIPRADQSRCRWPSTRGAACGLRPGTAIRTGSRPTRSTTSS